MQIILHIGAHKTASTHLQLALARARPALLDRGVALFGPDELRRRGLGVPEYLSLMADDPALVDHGARIRDALRAPSTQPLSRLVISDENLLGSAHNVELIRTARFYDRAASRLARLAALLPPGPLTLALAIRNPADFVVSAYTQRLMSGRLEDFAQYVGALDPACLRWSELIARIQGALPRAGWRVWRFEDYSANASAVLAALLGETAAEVRPGDGVAHPGLSQRAHAIVMAEAPVLAGQGAAAIRERVKTLRTTWPKGDVHPTFQPLDAETLRRAGSAYAQDMTRIAALPGVQTLWT